MAGVFALNLGGSDVGPVSVGVIPTQGRAPDERFLPWAGLAGLLTRLQSAYAVTMNRLEKTDENRDYTAQFAVYALSR